MPKSLIKSIIVTSIAALVVLVPAKTQGVDTVGFTIKTTKPVAEMKQASLEPLNGLDQILPPPPAPTPVAAKPVMGCGSDPQMAKIYQLESGCNTGAYNPGGCRGLGQACPGSKLPCSDSDWGCQDSWFKNYCVQAYGSIYNCYIFRINHNWY